MKRFDEYFMGIIGTVLIGIVFVCFALNKMHDTAYNMQNETDVSVDRWYIASPDGYFHLKDPVENMVAEWIQGEPYGGNKLGMLIESPYTYDEWIQSGKDIVGAEKILIDWYENYNGIFLPQVLFKSIKHIGSYRSVPVLIDAFQDEDLDTDARTEAALALGIIGDPRAEDSLIEFIQTLAESDDDISPEYELFSSNVIIVLEYIGTPRAVPVINKLLEDEKITEKDRQIYRGVINSLHENKNDYVIDWILRWNLGNSAENSKGLPDYKSFKLWKKDGKKIPDIGQILIALYKSEDERVSKSSILRAIEAVGSCEIADELINIITSETKKGCSERDFAMKALVALNCDEAINRLIQQVNSKDFSNEDIELTIKSTIVCPLKNMSDRFDVKDITKRVSELENKLDIFHNI